MLEYVGISMEMTRAVPKIGFWWKFTTKSTGQQGNVTAKKWERTLQT